ncbi:MAG TPA: tRNA (adenosine(37)-N6)-dimethylallyltransferase MiaA [Bryobacteraceae bacterium]|nr:tRNA (adenosine(37)-N6)-dimethylallyltransferase MiaA [Bryobacteraceae bacterium]
MGQRKVIAILGPTGSGKSELALCVAGSFAGEVVNCDSLQIYRYFDIGTAKLPSEARQGIPHHLIDILDPDQVFTAGEYARLGRRVLDEISMRERLPVLAGGTGFYLRALIDGLFPGPQRDQAVRDRLAARERRREGSLHRILRRFDPDAASRIHPRDLPKLIRALEVCLITRRPVTELFQQGRDALGGYGTLKIGLAPPRDLLYEKLDRRTRQMFEMGLVDEVRGILSRGFAASVKPFESHGYRQAIQFLNGELKLEEAIFYAQRNTRRYAKRQMTWFRQEPGIFWFSGFGDDTQLQQAVLERVREFLTPSQM